MSNDSGLARTIESAEVRGYATGHAKANARTRPEMRDWSAAREWAAESGYRTVGSKLAHYDLKERSAMINEGTGEHFKAKLADDLYQDFIDPKDVPEHHLSAPELTDEQAERLFELVSHRGPRRGWVPTTGELTLALVIMMSIVGLFVFYVNYYRW